MLREDQSSAINVSQQRALLADLLSNRASVYHASFAQQRLWFLDQLQGASATYNVHLGFWLQGSLDESALLAALQEILNRHGSLRTAFRLEGSELRQVVVHDLALSVPVVDLTHLHEDYAAIYRLAREEVEKPFCLGEAPLFRVRIFRVGANDHVLLCTMHHIITDSWSTQILARELAALYEAFSAGKEAPLEELDISYGDYSEWQHMRFETAPVQQQLTYWEKQLANAPAVLELPKDGPRPSDQTFAGAHQTTLLPGEIIGAVKTLATRCQATPFMVLLAAFKVLLFHYSGQPDLLVGVPGAGRNRVETENLVGFFVNTLVLRDDLSGNPEFLNLLLQVRESTLAAFANSDVSFEKIVEVLKPERNLSYNPIFQVMFSAIRSAVRSNTFGNLTAYTYEVTPSTSIVDLVATIVEATDGEWWIQIDYNTDLFHSTRIERMAQDYLAVLRGILEDPNVRIEDLSLDIAGSSGRASSLPPRLIQKSQSRGASSSITEGAALQGTGEEDLLLGIWKRVLGAEEVTRRDNFFDVGGHSLMAARLIAEIQAATGCKLPVSAVFRAPTVESFARLLGQDSIADADPILVRLDQGKSTQVPVFTIVAPGADSFGFALLALHVSPAHPVYKMQAAAPVVTGRFPNSQEIQELGGKYIREMRSVQPRGPYCLAAMCHGVLIAQEVILQLESAGEEVALFVIFDTWVRENVQIRWLSKVDYYVQRIRWLRSLSRKDQWAVMRQAFQRRISSSEGVIRQNWNDVYWPGEDFKPPRFEAPVLLFKRPRQPFFYIRDKQMGWGTRSHGGVEICEMNCGHFEMLREPHIHRIGELLGERLRIISQRASSLDVESSTQKRNGSPADNIARVESLAQRRRNLG